VIYNLLKIKRSDYEKYLEKKLASNESCTYICTTLIRNGYAKVAQLVERDLAKVEVAGSNPVFRSEIKHRQRCFFFSKLPIILFGAGRGGGTGRHAGLKIL
jgi:hypothetical protein